MKKSLSILFAIAILVLVGLACVESTDVTNLQSTVTALQGQVQGETGATATETTGNNASVGPADVEFTLTTGGDGHSLGFVGVGGDIDGLMNPTLVVQPGDVVQITLINGQPTEHDLLIDEFGATTGSITAMGEKAVINFVADHEGSFDYYCGIPGHAAAGMVGKLQVGVALEAAGTSIIKNPSDLPGPIGSRGPELVQVELVGQEVEGQLASGATYSYFTFNGTVPGPFIRAQVGDTVEITLRNETSNAFTHSVDLHAVNGPGGGSVYTSVAPGETKEFTFTALNPGIYVYHCATPSVPHHIASGMYGLILIEPAGGLPPVDREFYIMQGEIYTAEVFGSQGQLTFSPELMGDENPEYFVFNGAAGALATEENWLTAQVGDTVRIYIGVGGPNFTSSFHVIGEIFDRVYPFGSITSPVVTDVQTISVPPGSAWIVEFTLEVPGDYILVDHALSRLERGLVGILHVEGAENPDVFHEGTAIP